MDSSDKAEYAVPREDYEKVQHLFQKSLTTCGYSEEKYALSLARLFIFLGNTQYFLTLQNSLYLCLTIFFKALHVVVN